jgi:hypothetical protein
VYVNVMTRVHYVAHIQYKYPVCDEEENKRWKLILKATLNAKCRACRPKPEPTE